MEKNTEISYVLITPARNEEGYIAKTLESVVCQTVLPKKWVIVSDGSTDRTDEIVAEYAEGHEYIRLLRVSGHNMRNFGSKVSAFQAGLECLYGLEYDFIGNIDADVSFERNYFERILKEFLENSKLGIGGGTILEMQKGMYKERPSNRERYVAGAVQLFRRECYEEIGGFIPLKAGGEDTAAEIMARMKGWEVKSFDELKVWHHKPTGMGAASVWRARYQQGVEDYMVGYHMIYCMAKYMRRAIEKPYLLGSVLRMIGYSWSCLRRVERPVSRDFIDFHRREQIDRLKSLSIIDRNQS